jgi:hypothetical protein
MPPLIPGRAGRHVQALASPANQARALAQQQQGGISGTIPGTASDPTRVAVATGAIQTYPAAGRSPEGDQVAGVGIQVLNNAGDPVVVLGNLNATQASAADLPASFQDGGFAFVDADGNLIAGYSQETGLWGFGGGGGGAPAARAYSWQSQTLAGASPAKVTLYPDGAFGTAYQANFDDTGRFTAPADVVCQFTAQVCCSGAGTLLGALLVVNGDSEYPSTRAGAFAGAFGFGAEAAGVTMPTNQWAPISDIIALNEGDYVELWAAFTGSLTISNSTSDTYMAVTQLQTWVPPTTG